MPFRVSSVAVFCMYMLNNNDDWFFVQCDGSKSGAVAYLFPLKSVLGSSTALVLWCSLALSLKASTDA